MAYDAISGSTVISDPLSVDDGKSIFDATTYGGQSGNTCDTKFDRSPKTNKSSEDLQRLYAFTCHWSHCQVNCQKYIKMHSSDRHRNINCGLFHLMCRALKKTNTISC